MDNIDYQYEILQRLTRYYDNNRDRALEKYREKHGHFRDHMGLRLSMEEVVDSGKGEEVLNFLEMVLL